MAQKICPGCGNPLKDGAQFCGNCGIPLLPVMPGGGAVSPPAPVSPPLLGAKKILLIKMAAAILIILVIVSAGIFFVLPKIGITIFSSTHPSTTVATTGTIPVHLDSTKVHSFGAVKSSANGYTMVMDPVRVNKDVTLEKTMTYDKQADGKYAGSLTLHFTGTASSGAMQYQETIPKSFASDVKLLTFSVPPDRIIQTDPVVAWNKNVQGSMEIKVTSLEMKTGIDAKTAAEDSLINSSASECEKLTDPKDRFVCVLEIARKYRDTKTGKDISDLDLTQGVDATLAAVISKNPDKYCRFVATEQDALACRQAAFMMYVRDCNEGPADSRGDCIRKNLWQINNYHTILGACEYITDPALKAECTGSVDAGYCGKINDPVLRNKCLVHAAHRKADPLLCSGVTDAYLRDLCIGQVSLSKNDQSVCSGIRDTESRENCIAQIAANKGDSRICETIKDPDGKAACIIAAGFTATMSGRGDPFQNLSVCNTDAMKANKELHDLCIGMVAARSVNPDLCEQIEDEGSRDTCFLTLSLTGDTSVCTRIADDYLRDNCIKIIAEGTKDLSLCDDIQEEELAAECRNNTKHGVAAISLVKTEPTQRSTKVTGGSANPAGSVCTSPAFKLASQFLAGHGDATSGSGGIDPDHCYQAIAVNLGDTSMCSSIQRGAPMTKCYLLIAAKENDYSICNQMPATSDPQGYLKIDCLWEVGTKNNNVAACMAMGNQSIGRMFMGEMNQQTCLAKMSGVQSAGGSTP